MREFFLSVLIGYALGSFPTAYVLVKWKHDIDIRYAGSGSVGTMNAYDVTGSVLLAVAVLIIDVLKGVLPVLVVLMTMSQQFAVLATAGLSAIIGHSFPLWLRFRGGRGLATTAGVVLVIGWVFIIIWVALWTVVYMPTRNIHAANVLASIISPLIVGMMPAAAVQTLPSYTTSTNLMFFGIAFCVIVLVTHWKPVITFFRNHHR